MTTYEQQRGEHITLIADNGGGITLQIDDGARRYQHSYDAGRIAECAQCVIDYCIGSDISDWEGNQTDEHGWLDPSYDEQRNGGYRVLTISGVLSTSEDESWHNVRELRSELSRIATN